MTMYESILTKREKRELKGHVFQDQDLVGVDLSDADLRCARFERVLLAKCNLSGADLRGAEFVLCELRYVVLTGAQLGENGFRGTTLVETDGLTETDRQTVE